MKKTILLVNLCIFLGTPMVAISSESFKSSSERVNVLELYTSEGCSSCPPADRFVSEFKSDPRLWKQIIPVVFHVDYWDYIGWKDRFASSRYSDRQRNYARAENVSTVYTPGFVLNGNEWRSFFGLRKLSLEGGPAGVLELTIEGDNVSGVYQPAGSVTADLELNIAILGFDLETNVKAGENHGKTLRHDFTVLALKHVSMNQSGQQFTATSQLPMPAFTAPRLGVVAWVSESGDQSPLQATGGWLSGEEQVSR